MELSVYIHIPFCKSKCFYCDFLSFDKKERDFFDYTEALTKEIKAFDFTKYQVKTIFLGGGTPTVLPPLFLCRILEAFPAKSIQEATEITIEANPATVNLESLKMLKAAGVNRLSLGLQAWQDRLLKKLGRIHTQKEFLQTYEQAQQAGFDNISVDLMFGLPEQSLFDLQETLTEVIKLKPKHISLYSLILEEGTKFFEMYDEIEEELDREMYEKSMQQLKDSGYNKYEVSNFSKIGFESIHNTAYWQRKEYIGFGLTAHSFLNGERFSNSEDYEKYIINPCNAKENVQSLSIKDSMEEFIFLGLRMSDGISISEFEKCFGQTIFSVYPAQIENFVSQNLLKKENDRIFLTESGFSVSNRVFTEFLLES